MIKNNKTEIKMIIMKEILQEINYISTFGKETHPFKYKEEYNGDSIRFIITHKDKILFEKEMYSCEHIDVDGDEDMKNMARESLVRELVFMAVAKMSDGK